MTLPEQMGGEVQRQEHIDEEIHLLLFTAGLRVSDVDQQLPRRIVAGVDQGIRVDRPHRPAKQGDRAAALAQTQDAGEHRPQLRT